jgi:hypothetical protein
MAFLAAWVLVTVIFSLNARSSSGIPSPVALVVFAGVGLIPAFVIASGFSANPGVRARLASLVRPRGHLLWYLVALLLAPALRLLSVPVSRLLGWETISAPALAAGTWALAGSAALSFLYTVIASGGLNEETGCRRHLFRPVHLYLAVQPQRGQHLDGEPVPRKRECGL